MTGDVPDADDDRVQNHGRLLVGVVP